MAARLQRSGLPLARSLGSEGESKLRNKWLRVQRASSSSQMDLAAECALLASSCFRQCGLASGAGGCSAWARLAASGGNSSALLNSRRGFTSTTRNKCARLFQRQVGGQLSTHTRAALREDAASLRTPALGELASPFLPPPRSLCAPRRATFLLPFSCATLAASAAGRRGATVWQRSSRGHLFVRGPPRRGGCGHSSALTWLEARAKLARREALGGGASRAASGRLASRFNWVRHTLARRRHSHLRPLRTRVRPSFTGELAPGASNHGRGKAGRG